MNCRENQELLEPLLRNELSPEQSEGLLAHLEQCGSCEEHFDLLQRLMTEQIIPEPDELSLARVRGEVLRTLRAEPRATAGSGRNWWRFAAAGFAAVITGGLLLYGGYRLGMERVVSPASGLETARLDDGEAQLTSQIHRAALRSRDRQDLENSPYLYSNVQVRKLGEGRLALSFDVSRHLDLDLQRDDPLVNEVLVQSLLHDRAVGSRLKAISVADERVDDRLTSALIRTMLNDPNLAVRLKAETKLLQGAPAPELVDALVEVLQKEESVAMRLDAIDYLTRHEVSHDVLRNAVDEGVSQGREAVLVRLQPSADPAAIR